MCVMKPLLLLGLVLLLLRLDGPAIRCADASLFRPTSTTTTTVISNNKRQQPTSPATATTHHRRQWPQNLRPRRRHGGAVDDVSCIPDGTALVSEEIFNLIKSIVGAGVLGLPSGVSSFANAPTAIIPAICLLTTIGIMATQSFIQLGHICELTKSTSYTMAWEKSVGSSSGQRKNDNTMRWIPNLACFLVTFCTVLTYSMILSSTIPKLLSLYLDINNISRNMACILLTIFVFLPLCLLRTLSSLAPFSLLGICGMVYTCTIMTIRWFTGAYTKGATLYNNVPTHLQPSFGNKGWTSVFTSQATILVSMLSTAYMAHYNAPKFYWELKDRKQQFSKVVWRSFGASMALMAMTVASGFGMFGGNCDSVILNNFADIDRPMQIARLAVTCSLIFSYPLAFVGVRENVFDLFRIPPSKRTPLRSDVLTVILLIIITGLAMSLKDIRVILAVGGATWGNLLVYVFPSIMTIRAASQYAELRPQVPFCIVQGLFGMLIGVVGTVRAIQSAF